MANVQDFQSWFTSTYFNREAFEATSKERFQDLQDATVGWAANGLMTVINAAVGFMNEGEEYLEIGTYGGRSLIAALRDNNKRAQVLDPFANTVPTVRERWEQAVDQFGVRDRITLYEEFAEKFEGNLPPIGVFMYDGNHDSGHTYEGLKRFEPFLADRAIIIVDDYSIPGGSAQQVFPGHRVSHEPVRTDTERWLIENRDRTTLLTLTPWTHQQAIICYERN